MGHTLKIMLVPQEARLSVDRAWLLEAYLPHQPMTKRSILNKEPSIKVGIQRRKGKQMRSNERFVGVVAFAKGWAPLSKVPLRPMETKPPPLPLQHHLQPDSCITM